jgi:hypothetical protein
MAGFGGLQICESGIGCVVGVIFLGTLAYADDSSLLAPIHRVNPNPIKYEVLLLSAQTRNSLYKVNISNM